MSGRRTAEMTCFHSKDMESCVPLGCCAAELRSKDDSRWFGLFAHLGRMIFSLGWSEAKSLKVLNLTEGGWRKGLAPKLNSHCWYDIKLAAAKKPDLKGEESADVVHLRDSRRWGERHRKEPSKTREQENARRRLRGRGEDLFFWWQLMSVQIEEHLLLAEVQEEANSVP